MKFDSHLTKQNKLLRDLNTQFNPNQKKFYTIFFYAVGESGSLLLIR